MVDLSIGDTIETSGPDGDFIIDDSPRGEAGPKNYIFIAGGIGITPFRSILLQMDFEKLSINVQLYMQIEIKTLFLMANLNRLLKK